MALFKIFKGKSKNLGITGGTNKTKDGYAYFTPDDGKFYIDIAEGQTPIVGHSAAEGANRICINDGGFMDGLILDCGTASGWKEIEVIYLDFGDSSSSYDDTNIIYYDSGDSSSLIDETNVIIYDGGNSYS